MGWPEERVRIVGQLMGGGFGGKEDVMGQIHVAMLANVTQRPVKLLFDRHESLLVHPKRHATQIRVKMGAKKNGRSGRGGNGAVWRHGRVCVARREGDDPCHHALGGSV